MTAIRSIDSLKYGSRLFLYLLGVLVVGGGVLGLGLALGLDHAQAFLDNAAYSKTELAGGTVLSVIGSFTLLTGLFGLVHKLIADSVAAGATEISRTAGARVTVDSGGTTAGTVTPDGTPSIGPSPGEQAARKHGSVDANDGGTGPESEPVDEQESTKQPEQTDEPTEQSEPAQQPDPLNEPAEPVADASTQAEPATGEPDTRAEAGLDEDEQSETAEPRTTHDIKSMSQRSDGERADTTPRTDDETATAWEEETETPPSGDGTQDDVVETSTGSETETETPVTDGPTRVPSPEEIAFGSNSEDGEEQEESDTEESDDEKTTQASGSEDTGSGGFGTDPLGGPTDE